MKDLGLPRTTMDAWIDNIISCTESDEVVHMENEIVMPGEGEFSENFLRIF